MIVVRFLWRLISPAAHAESVQGWLDFTPLGGGAIVALVTLIFDLPALWTAVSILGVALAWAVIGTFSMFLEVEHHKARPAPNIIYREPFPASRPVTSIYKFDRPDRFGQTEGVQTRNAQFARAGFRNQRRDSPQTVSVSKPHVTITVLNSEGEQLAIVKNGRIAEAKERFEMDRSGFKAATPGEARLDEIRVGEWFTVDLAMRFDGDESAHTWSNDTPAVGELDLTPGDYVFRIEIDAENLRHTHVEDLILTVPTQQSVDMPVRRRAI